MTMSRVFKELVARLSVVHERARQSDAAARVRPLWHFCRNWRRTRWSYPLDKYRLAYRILRCPPVVTASRGDLTVCLLTCRRDWLLGLWTLVSFYVFSGRRDPLLVYSDGTVPPKGRKAFAQIFPGSRFVEPGAADRFLSEMLREYPLCREFRARQPCGRRLVDFPAMAGTPRILMLDADVLFLEPPHGLMAYLDADEDDVFVFQPDCQSAYFAEPDAILARFGVEVPERANVGILVASVRGFDYGRIEAWLRYPEVRTHFWAEQTLWAMYAGRDRARLLGPAYAVRLERGIRPGSVVKHYVSPIRELIYTEGLRELRSRLHSRGIRL
jgi:hypothetical protein